MDYLIGKLPYQTEVKIRTRIRPDSKTYHDQHITFSLLFKFGTYLWQSVINDAIIDEWCKRIHAYICAKGWYFEHLMQMFTFLRSEEKSSDFC